MTDATDPGHRRLRRIVVTLATVGVLAWSAASLGGSQFTNLVFAGLATGGIIALSGLGLVLTYKATGVFNFAHGAMATLIAYVFWQLQRVWGLPLIVAAPLALMVAGPLLGVVFERFVFRPLEQQEASTAEKLVATLGAFVLLLGAVTLIWTNEAKADPGTLFSRRALCLGDCSAGGFGVTLGTDQLGIIVIVTLASVLLWLLFARTHLGTEIRAVVDRRELAELSVVNANRVSAIAWALGSGLAGLTGVLLGQTLPSLRPFDLTLLVLETFAVAALARLTSLPRALFAGLGLGIATNLLTRFEFGSIADLLGASAAVQDSVNDALGPIIPNALVFIFLGALLLQSRMGSGSDEGDAGAFVARASQVGAQVSARVERLTNAMIVVVALALPFVFADELSTMRRLHFMVGLAVIFLAIVAVTGFSGHINLAPAAFAGFGAFITARAVNGALAGLPEVPVVLAMLIGGLACVPIGIVTGYPALRRRGLALGLTTLALGLVIERFVLNNFYFISGPSSTTLPRPALFEGDVVFYLYELAVLGLVVLFLWNLRRGEVGRILGAMRDSEHGARSVGLDLRRHKLFIFAASAFIAGVGGSLVSQAIGTFDPIGFITFNSLIWFAVVVVAGVASIHGAILGAFLFVGLDALLPVSGMTTLLIGAAALLLGRLPGGLIGLIKRVATARFASGVDAGSPRPTVAGPSAGPRRLEPTERARELLGTTAGGDA